MIFQYSLAQGEAHSYVTPKMCVEVSCVASRLGWLQQQAGAGQTKCSVVTARTIWWHDSILPRAARLSMETRRDTP